MCNRPAHSISEDVAIFLACGAYQLLINQLNEHLSMPLSLILVSLGLSVPMYVFWIKPLMDRSCQERQRTDINRDKPVSPPPKPIPSRPAAPPNPSPQPPAQDDNIIRLLLRQPHETEDAISEQATGTDAGHLYPPPGYGLSPGQRPISTRPYPSPRSHNHPSHRKPGAVVEIYTGKSGIWGFITDPFIVWVSILLGAVVVFFWAVVASY
jgi:hypothetical protein